MSSSKRTFSAAISSVHSMSNSPEYWSGFPLTKPLQKYFGGLDRIPLLNHNPSQRRAYISSIFVFRPTTHPLNPNATFTECIHDRKWCYNVQGVDGGQYVANYNPIDGILYALHQSICDGILIGTKNLIYAADFQFMPYFSSNFEHIKSLEPNLSELLFSQNELLRNQGYLHRPFPAVIITTQTGKPVINHDGESIDFLDCEVFKHINPFTGKYNDIHIVTSLNGANEIRNRWDQYPHLANRNVDDVLIVLSNNDNPNTIRTELIPEILYGEPLNMKYVTCEGGIALMEKLISVGAMNQLNFNLMKQPVSELCDVTQHTLECIDIPWRPCISFDYSDYNCQFVLFDPVT